LGTLTVLLTYFLVKELFPINSPRRSRQATPLSWSALPLITAFLLAISPWHIYISRLGHEVNAGLTFSVLGILFFLKYINREKVLFIFLSSAFLALSFYTYQSQKIFIPLIVLVLGLIYRKNLWFRKKEVLAAMVLALLIIWPLFKASLSPQAMIRFRGTSIFNNRELIKRSSDRIAHDYRQGNIFGLIFDNRRVAAGLAILQSYFSHFNPTWLFFNQGAEKHKTPGLGVFYLWELPLILVRAYQFVKRKFSKQMKLLVFSWLLLAPLPAGLTTEAPHAMRIFNLLPIPQILGALGAVTIWSKISKSWRKPIIAMVSVSLLFSLLYLGHNYFVNFPREQSSSFQYPLSQAIGYVLKNENQYQKIVFSNKDNCYQSYMFFLFFSRYDPELYQKQGGTISGGFAETHFFGKYEFRPIDWGNDRWRRGILYVGNIRDFSLNVQPLQIFKLLDNRITLMAVGRRQARRK